jgi:hypothetical protein
MAVVCGMPATNCTSKGRKAIRSATLSMSLHSVKWATMRRDDGSGAIENVLKGLGSGQRDTTWTHTGDCAVRSSTIFLKDQEWGSRPPSAPTKADVPCAVRGFPQRALVSQADHQALARRPKAAGPKGLASVIGPRYANSTAHGSSGEHGFVLTRGRDHAISRTRYVHPSAVTRRWSSLDSDCS